MSSDEDWVPAGRPLPRTGVCWTSSAVPAQFCKFFKNLSRETVFFRLQDEG
jgi:hypothetical protein